MERIFILGPDSLDNIAEAIGATRMDIPDNYSSNIDCKLHDFITQHFGGRLDALILDADTDSHFAHNLAIHTRLSLEAIGANALCPIIFVTELSYESFIKQYTDSNLFSTGNVYVTCLSELSNILPHVRPLELDNYKSDFLERIKIKPDGETSGHGLANQWGASVMYRIACGEEIGMYEYPDYDEFQKKAYYKYVLASITDLQTLIYKEKLVGRIIDNSISAEGKRVLLIDDCANKGWEYTLRAILEDAELDVICQDGINVKPRIKDISDLTPENKEKLTSQDYDLYILDLRLDGDAEEDIYETSAFSGMKILKYIKSLNRGNQVIMFTASNKAWNFKALLAPDAGANGYYIKESPEYNFPEKFSEANLSSFKQDVTRCLSRRYLKSFYRFKESIAEDSQTLLDNLNNKGIATTESGEEHFLLRMLNEVKAQCDIAFHLADYAMSPEMYRYAFLATFRPLEIFASYLTSYLSNTNQLMYCGKDGGLIAGNTIHAGSKWIIEKGNKPPRKLPASVVSSIFNKIKTIYLFICKRKDKGLLDLFNQLVHIRNAIVHTKCDVNKGRQLTEYDIYTNLAFSSPQLDLIYSKERYQNLFIQMSKLGCLYVNQDAIEKNKLAKENSSSTIREDQMDVLVDKDIANYQISIELMFEVLKDIYDAIRKPVLSGQLSELNIKDENDTTEL